MPAHVLRSFLYLDTQIVSDFLAGLGFTVEEQAKKIMTERTGGIGGEAGINPIKLTGKKDHKESEETTAQVIQTEAARFQRLFEALEKDEGFGYFETMNAESWSGIVRNSLLEVTGDLSLTKLGRAAAAVDSLTQMADMVAQYTGQSPIDPQTQVAIELMQAFSGLEEKQGIPIILSVLNSPEYKLFAYLNRQYLRVDRENLSGTVTLFCKVQRKLAGKETIQPFDPVKIFEQLPLNHKQRRDIKKGRTQMPKDFVDTIKSPAVVVTPVAIFL